MSTSERNFNKSFLDVIASAEDKEILEGIPTGAWADHWATQQEEKGRSFSGQDIMDHAPKVPKWAHAWADNLAAGIVSANGHTLEDLYQLVKSHGYPYDRQHFGYHLGMQAVGHGVSWSDDTRSTLPHKAIGIPHREFYK